MKSLNEFLTEYKVTHKSKGYSYVQGKPCTECGNTEYKLGYRGSDETARCTKCSKEFKSNKI